MNIVGDNVRKIRESKGYSQEYVAEKLQISQPVYCKIESGKQKMRVERLLRLSEILDVAPESLLTSEGEISLSNCQNTQAVYTINGNPTFQNQLKDDLIDQLKKENVRLHKENDTLLGMLQKYMA